MKFKNKNSCSLQVTKTVVVNITEEQEKKTINIYFLGIIEKDEKLNKS